MELHDILLIALGAGLVMEFMDILKSVFLGTAAWLRWRRERDEPQSSKDLIDRALDMIMELSSLKWRLQRAKDKADGTEKEDEWYMEQVVNEIQDMLSQVPGVSNVRTGAVRPKED